MGLPNLTTKDEQVAHHFGHGTQDRAALLLSLNRLAWLFHTGGEWRDDKDALLAGGERSVRPSAMISAPYPAPWSLTGGLSCAMS
jgi:hypothetical protein